MLYHRELVERMQEKYPPGTRVEVVSLCNEEEHLKPGMKGTVVGVDDQPALLVNWYNSSTSGQRLWDSSQRPSARNRMAASRWWSDRRKMLPG